MSTGGSWLPTALGVLAFTGALRTHISQLFSLFLVHLLEIYSTLGGTGQINDSVCVHEIIIDPLVPGSVETATGLAGWSN